MILTITGHRPNKLGGYSNTVANRLIDLAIKEIALCHEYDPIEYVIQGMAQGWDQACGHACVKLRLPFYAYIPCDGQEALWPTHAQREYNHLLSFAAQVIQVSSGNYSGYKMVLRDYRMVDDGNFVLALWNGSQDTHSGTGKTLIYAKLQNRPIRNCWDSWVGYIPKTSKPLFQ